MRMPETGGGPVAGASIAAMEDGEWRMPSKDFQATRYSALDQITPENVRALRPVWNFSTGELRGHEGQPLVVNGTMYLVTPFPNRVFAIDLARPGGRIKWQFEPRPDRAAQGVACCDVVNRGAAYGDGKIFFNTLDNQTIALDAESGRELWRARMGDINDGQTMTMAPLVARGKVFVGNSGGEFGVRGWIAALDVNTGEVVWRGYSTGPDREVLIDHEYFRPFYEQDRGRDLGVSTWPPNAWEIGGATVWGWLSYDPALNLIYHGTANPGPWNPELRPGDNKWSAAILARNADDGRVRWAYQVTPHDEHDYDAQNESILVDLPIGGETRRVLVHFDKNGFAYTIDRETGEVLVARPFGPLNWAHGVDLRTGRPVKNEEKSTGTNRWTRNICPIFLGAKDIQPAAFSPRTGLFYVPTINLCMDFQGTEANYISGTPYLGASWRGSIGPGGHGGELIAWDAVGGRKVWGITERFPVWSGALATAGDVVFYGTMDGWFKAVHAETGEPLWQYHVGSGIVGNPISYRGPDGRQYVAVYAGLGGNAAVPMLISAALDEPTAAAGLTGPMGDLMHYSNTGGMLFVFGL